MITILKTKSGQFEVRNTGKNNKILKPSETFKKKESAWNNIWADWQANYYQQIARAPKIDSIIITDKSGSVVSYWRLYADKKKFRVK